MIMQAEEDRLVNLAESFLQEFAKRAWVQIHYIQ